MAYNSSSYGVGQSPYQRGWNQQSQSQQIREIKDRDTANKIRQAQQQHQFQGAPQQPYGRVAPMVTYPNLGRGDDPRVNAVGTNVLSPPQFQQHGQPRLPIYNKPWNAQGHDPKKVNY
jgi:hypothetical protein